MHLDSLICLSAISASSGSRQKNSRKETSIHYSHASRYKTEKGTESVQNTASAKWGMGRPYRKVKLEWGCMGFLREGWGEQWVWEVLQKWEQEGCCERRYAKIRPSGNKPVFYSNTVKRKSVFKRKPKELGA